MPSFTAQSHKWKTKAQGGDGTALLMVHGIGNAKPGSYDYLNPKIQQALGTKAGKTPVYWLYYDFINDWFKEKIRLEAAIGECRQWVGAQIGGSLAQVGSEVIADVFWPVLSLSARNAVQDAYLQQIQRLVLDGMEAGFPPDFQKISIVCHSLGCFHTYEILHRCVNDASAQLHPVHDGLRFSSVVFMASPVQLIRSVSQAMSLIVPSGLVTTSAQGLFGPTAKTLSGSAITSVKRWISITGALDPVGGHVFRKKMDWAYMDVPASAPFGGQQSLIDSQDWLSVTTEAELRQLLQTALAQRQAGQIPLNDPHSWGDYIARHTNELENWLCV